MGEWSLRGKSSSQSYSEAWSEADSEWERLTDHFCLSSAIKALCPVCVER
jgi:hypothetical protein